VGSPETATIAERGNITDQAVRPKAKLPPQSASIKSFVTKFDTLGATVHQAQCAVWSFSR
jgi:hypothetical protein